MGEGETLKNGVIGALFAIVFHFVPLVGSMLAPIAGGWLAGHLQKEDVGGGAKAGLAAGLIGLIPAIAIGVLVFFLFTFLGVISGDPEGFVGLTVFGGLLGVGGLLVFGAYNVILSLVGGVVVGAIAGTGD